MRETSMAAYREIVLSGLLGDMQEKVLRALCENAEGAMTGSEIDVFLQSPSAHKRLSELEQMGVARPVGDQQCRVTGRSVLGWTYIHAQPTPLLKPKKLTRKKPPQKVLEAAVPYLRDLYVSLRSKGDEHGAQVIAEVGGWLGRWA